jgi:hypothetical protein
MCRFLLKIVAGDDKPSMGSRLAGAFVTVCYGMIIILPVVFFLGMIPPFNERAEAVKKDVVHSGTYMLLKPFNKFIAAPAAKETNTAPAMQQVAEDERMQEILNDPEIKKAAESKNYAALLANPKVMALAQDPAFVQKMLAAYSTMKPADISPEDHLKSNESEQ